MSMPIRSISVKSVFYEAGRKFHRERVRKFLMVCFRWRFNGALVKKASGSLWTNKMGLSSRSRLYNNLGHPIIFPESTWPWVTPHFHRALSSHLHLQSWHYTLPSSQWVTPHFRTILSLHHIYICTPDFTYFDHCTKYPKSLPCLVSNIILWAPILTGTAY